MRLWLVAIAAVVVVAAACDQVPLTSPTGSTISLSIDKSIVPVNGQATDHGGRHRIERHRRAQRHDGDLPADARPR